MDLHLIDEFRRRTNSSYDEARYYLEKNNGDLLEAIIAFEKDRTGFQYHGNTRRTGGFSRAIIRFVQRLFDIKLVITDKSLRTFTIPIIILIVLSPVWHLLALLAVIMLIMGYKFGFQEIPDPNVDIGTIIKKIRNKVKDGTRSY